jgi:hypothetical protein
LEVLRNALVAKRDGFRQRLDGLGAIVPGGTSLSQLPT